MIVNQPTALRISGSSGLHVRRARWSSHGLPGEFLRFCTVGVVSLGVDLSVFNLLRSGSVDMASAISDSPLTSKVLSVCMATVLAWLGHRWWTFRSRSQAGMTREMAKFGLANAAGLGIALSCLGFSHYVLGLTSQLADNLSGNLIGLVLGAGFRFWAYRRLVFVSHRGGSE